MTTGFASLPPVTITPTIAAFIFGAVLGGALLGYMVYAWFALQRRRPRAIIIQKRNSAWVKVAEKPVPILKESFDFKGQTYLIKPEMAIYLDKGAPIFIYEYGRAEPLSMDHTAKFDAKTLKQFVRSNVLTQLLRAAQPQTMGGMVFVFLLIGVVMGLLLGLVIAPYLPALAHHAITSATNSTTTHIPTVPGAPPS